MQIVEVTDIHGRKHKIDLDALDAKHFAKDGDKVNFTMMCMDTGGGLFICDSNQIPKGATNMPNEYKLTDAEKRVEAAYQQMCRDVSNAWRGKDYKPPAETTEISAYDAMCRDLQNAWGNGR